MASAQPSVDTTRKQLILGQLRPGLALLGIFAIVGVSLGLAGNGGISMMNEQFVQGAEGEFAQGLGQLLVAAVFIQSSLTTVFLGPVIGTLGSVIVTRSRPLKSAVATGTIFSFIGFFLMVGIALFLMAMALSSGDSTGGTGSGGSEIGQMTKPIIYSAVPTTVAGGLGGLIGSRL